MIAHVFPGQASQFPGMGADLYQENANAKDLFEQANDLLGFRITDIMFGEDAEALKQTRITQPAVFLHSVITYLIAAPPTPASVAGHSLGEYSALVAAEALSFSDGLLLVQNRAEAMEKCCQDTPGTMAAIIGLEDKMVESICQEVGDQVVTANYNCPGQLVISGTVNGVKSAIELAKGKGAKRAMEIAVGGAFHSPLMDAAKTELMEAINKTEFQKPICPVYQNVTAKASSDAKHIQQLLIEQVSAPVLWTATIQNMIADGVTEFLEVGGNGKVLRGLIRRIDRDISTACL